MGIPELKATQVKTLRDTCAEFGAFSQVVPEEKLDGTEFNEAMEQLRDTEQMLILGLIKEITEEHAEKVGRLLSITGRQWRIFQMTPMGLAMFSKEDGKPN
jgi:hypothetical protein